MVPRSAVAREPFYNITVAQRIPFAVDHDARASPHRAVHRHGVLRTIYPLVGGSAVQRVLPPAPVRCEVIDLRGAWGVAADAELQRLAAEAAQRPFDLAAGPVFRAALVRLGPFESALLFVVHHIAADQTSIDIIFRELGTLYADAVAGRTPRLDALSVRYADFAVWQREWLRGDVVASQAAYWQRQLAGLATLDLPTDRPRPPIPTFRGPQLQGKLRVFMGELDTFYLDGAARLLKESLAGLGSDAVVEIVPGKDHFTLMSQEFILRMRREMVDEFLKHHRP